MTTKRPFDLLIFDWEGTLADSLGNVLQCFVDACDAVNVTPPTREALREYLGLSIDDIIDGLFPDIDQRQQACLLERYRYFYFGQAKKACLFPDTLATLATLKSSGYLLAVATGCGRQGLSKHLEDTGLQAMFDTTRTADETYSKPNPQMVEEILAELSVEPTKAILIGDSDVDMQMARNAGIQAIAMTGGTREESAFDEYEPLACIDELHSLLDILAKQTV